ncbi:MAG: SUMF1/EgtB/PvdO family nonheme iron enzyme [bacterium]
MHLLIVLALLPAPRRLAVLELGNRAALPAPQIRYLADVVRSVALRLPRGRFFVLTRENIVAQLPPGTDLEACEGECEVETARNVGADLVVSGEVVPLGDELRVALRLHGVAEGQLLASSRGAAGTVAGLEGAVQGAAERLLATLTPAPAPAPPPTPRTAPPPPVPLADRLPAGLHFVGVAGGRFQMGDAALGGSATPAHDVVLAGFGLTRTEVTTAQYAACVWAGVCAAPSRASPRCTTPRDGQLPQTCVSAADAARFCAWVGGRLPSEAEWERAASPARPSAPLARLFQRDGDGCEAAIIRDARGAGCGRRQPWPVCSRPASERGLCDLVGNVAEWVADCWHRDYRGAPRDGRAWTDRCDGDGQVLRGGGYADDRRTAHPRERRSRARGEPRVDIGFRCAR